MSQFEIKDQIPATVTSGPGGSAGSGGSPIAWPRRAPARPRASFVFAARQVLLAAASTHGEASASRRTPHERTKRGGHANARQRRPTPDRKLRWDFQIAQQVSCLVAKPTRPGMGTKTMPLRARLAEKPVRTALRQSVSRAGGTDSDLRRATGNKAGHRSALITYQ